MEPVHMLNGNHRRCIESDKFGAGRNAGFLESLAPCRPNWSFPAITATSDELPVAAGARLSAKYGVTQTTLLLMLGQHQYLERGTSAHRYLKVPKHSDARSYPY